MIRAVALTLLCASVADAQPLRLRGPPGPEAFPRRPSGTRFGLAYPGGEPLFSLLPLGGGGVSQSVDLCDQFRDQLTGPSAFCLYGDGTSSDAGLTLTAVGSPTTESRPLCPNGADCTSTTSQRITAGNYLRTANISSPAGSFSVGCLVRADSTAITNNMITHWSTGDQSFLFRFTNAPGGTSSLFTSDGTITQRDGPVLTPAAWHFVSATYTHVGAGAVNGATVYLDGIAGSASTTMRPPMAAAGIPVALGVDSSGSSPLTGNLSSCFLTEKVLTATQHASMASAALGGNLSGTAGQAVTFTRASASTCSKSTGEVSHLPSGRMCLTNGGIRVRPAVTDVLLYSEQFDHASWTKDDFGGSSTVSANTSTVIAPDGTRNSERAVADGALGLIQAVQSGGGAFTGSIYAKSVSGTGDATLSMDANVTSQTLTLTTAWQRFSRTQTLTAVATPAAPTATAAVGVGLLAGTYCYSVSATNAFGETLPSAQGCVTLSITGDVALSWTAVTGATGYKLYGRTAGSQLLMATQAGTTFTDNGSVTPSGAVASRNSTADHTFHFRITSPRTVDVWGGMVHSGSVANDYCRSEGTAATCVGELPTTPNPASLSRTEGCAHICINPDWSGVVQPAGTVYYLNANTAATARLAHSATTDTLAAFDGTNTASVGAAFTAGTRKCYLTTWSAAANSMRTKELSSGTAGSSVSFSTLPAFSANLNIGSNATAGQSLSTLSDIRLGSTPTGCGVQ